MMIFRYIDELTRPDHSFLDENDDCFYFAEYPTGKKEDNYNNPVYSLINNIKKPVSQKNQPYYKYKIRDIQRCSKALVDIFNKYGDIGEYTIVPVPPSKTKNNPNYDPRLMDILSGLTTTFNNADVRELIVAKSDMTPSHESSIRPSINKLKSNYMIDEGLIQGCRKDIILFDDVLTSGAHFKACKELLLEYSPDSDIIGYFIARRLLPDPSLDFYNDDDELPF
ncbi:hypothetical protein ACF3OC_08385 [Sphingobacterium cellulitidis]|uniref:hypothetical protein n=1 Tax=Sphingobacterium cellulitidis TaxID=1768011 RepID=UPI00370CFDD1